MLRQNSVQPINGLTPLPIQAKCQWVSKTVTTHPPKYTPHTEYSLGCELGAEVPVLVTLILGNSQTLLYQRFWRSAASAAVGIRLSFFPYDWDRSEAVQVNLYQCVTDQGGGVRTTAFSEALKQDPRQLVATPWLEAASFYTGTIIDLAVINLSLPLYARLLVTLKSDTEPCRGRWRLKQSLPVDLPPQLSFLKQGHCSYRVPL